MLILLKKEVAGHTLVDALNDVVQVPKRPIESPFVFLPQDALRLRVSVTLLLVVSNRVFLNPV